MNYLSNNIICKFIGFAGYTSIVAFILIFLSLIVSIGGYQILLSNLKKYNKMQYDYIIYKGSSNWFIRFSKLSIIYLLGFMSKRALSYYYSKFDAEKKELTTTKTLLKFSVTIFLLSLLYVLIISIIIIIILIFFSNGKFYINCL